MKKMQPFEVFEYLDEEWRWITIDSTGDSYIHQEEPEKTKHGWDSDHMEWCPVTFDFDGPWGESLFERPKPKVKYKVWGAGKIFLISEGDKIFLRDGAPSVTLPYNEAPPEVAEWFHKIMEQSK